MMYGAYGVARPLVADYNVVSNPPPEFEIAEQSRGAQCMRNSAYELPNDMLVVSSKASLHQSIITP